MSETSTIGDRVRAARDRRRYTQEELAERSGLSVSTIRKLEQGVRPMARIVTLAAIANATGTELPYLLGRQEHLGHDHGIMPLQNVLLSVSDLPGIVRPPADAEPPAPAGIRAAVADAWGLYWAGRFGELAAVLPGVVTSARAAFAEHGAPCAGVLTQACQLSADLCVHTGHNSTALSAARMAMEAALGGSDELQWAAAAGTASWVLLNTARHADAEHVAKSAAARIEPPLSSAPAAHVTVWGSLLLSAAAAAAGRNDAGAVEDYLTLTRSAARITRNGDRMFERDRYDYQTNFGRTQAEMQACYDYVTLAKDGAALRAATAVRRGDLRPISWGAHNLDVAAAHLRLIGRGLLDHHEEAVGALRRAHDVSPEWFGHQPNAREGVRDALEAGTRRNPALRELAKSVGI